MNTDDTPLLPHGGYRKLRSYKVAEAEPELVANAMLCAVNQAAYLLRRQIESQGREFLRKGGFTENLYRQRQQARARGKRPGQSDKSDRSDKSDGSDAAGRQQ